MHVITFSGRNDNLKCYMLLCSTIYENVFSIVASVPEEEMLVLGGDFNRHVDEHSAGFEGVHGGSGYDMRNQDGLRILDFCVTNKLAITKTFFEDDPKKMASILSQQYKSIFTTLKDIPDASLKPPQNESSLSEIIITNKDIKEAMDDMTITLAPGSDRITASICKEYANQLMYPIKKIWQASLESGKVPEGTAQAVITSIYKGGVKSNEENYQPMALNNRLPKIFKRIQKKSMVEYLESNRVMNLTQHGLTHKRSTITQILSFYEDIVSKQENRDDADAIYLDFSKSIDKVDHNILLHKIKALNITGKILKWEVTKN